MGIRISTRPAVRAGLALTVAAATAMALAGCTIAQPVTRPQPSRSTSEAAPSAAPTSPADTNAVAMSPAQKKVAALVEKQKAIAASPPAKGLVVASTSIATADGAVSFHVAVTATGDDDYVAVISDFHSRVAGAPYQMFFRQFPESIGSCIEEGVSFGYDTWGGPVNSEQVPTEQVDLSQAGDDPSFLENVVITTSPTDLSSGCGWTVAAVAPLTWHTPDRHPGLAPVDSGSAPGATGKLTRTTGATSSVPETYTVARGDTMTGIEARFGVTERDLRYLNARADPDNLPIDYGETLNLDPSRR